MATSVLSSQSSTAPISSSRKSTFWHLFQNILFYVVLGLILLFAAFSIYGRLNGGTLRFGDDEIRVVLTGSMDGEPTSYRIPKIKTGSAVVIKDVPKNDSDANAFYEQLAVGDVLTFVDYLPNGSHVLVTHRIVAIDDLGNQVGYLYTLKGDADSGIQSVSSTEGLIIGQVTSVSYPWGVFFTFLNGKWGLLTLVILPACGVCCYEVSKIIKLVRNEKHQTSEARIKELEAQVASLQAKQNEEEHK